MGHSPYSIKFFAFEEFIKILKMIERGGVIATVVAFQCISIDVIYSNVEKLSTNDSQGRT